MSLIDKGVECRREIFDSKVDLKVRLLAGDLQTITFQLLLQGTSLADDSVERAQSDHRH